VANVRRLRRAAKTRNARNAEVLKTVVDDDLFLGIERVKSMFQSLKMDRTGNPFGAEHPVIQTIDQLEVPAAISAKAFRLVTPKTIGIRIDSVV
jgi:hypothetical protein